MVNKKKVLVRGTVKASMTVIALGGQTPPILNAGERLEWKKAQKKSEEKRYFRNNK